MNLVAIVDVGFVVDPLGSKNAMSIRVCGVPMGAPLRFKRPTKKRLEPTRISLDAITGIAFAPADKVGLVMTGPPGLVGEAEPQATPTTNSDRTAIDVRNLITRH
jgi:hypothetical protein